MLHILLTGMHAGTKRKLLGLSSETLALLAKLDEQADARAEERERKMDATGGRFGGEKAGRREETRRTNANYVYGVYAANDECDCWSRLVFFKCSTPT